MEPHSSFTYRFSNIQNRLITPCGVYPAFPQDHYDEVSGQTRYRALWDTGANISVITQRVVDDLGIPVEGYIPVGQVDGEFLAQVYSVALYLPNAVTIPALQVVKAALTGTDVLIGMDIINLGDFAVSNRNGKTMFSFRMPSVIDFDFAAETQGYM